MNNLNAASSLKEVFSGGSDPELRREVSSTTPPRCGIHTFYWNVPICYTSHLVLTPNKTELKGELKSAIETQWGSVEAFVEAFTKVTVAHFGSGWSWLVKKADGSLEILSTVNAANPLRGSGCLLETDA